MKPQALSRDELHDLLLLTDPVACDHLTDKHPAAANRLRLLIEEVKRLRARSRRHPARIVGVSHYRVATNPLEREFDLKWRTEQEGASPLLAPLLIDQRIFGGDVTAAYLRYEQPSERDFEVAATVVQWLGTNVGRCFLEEVLRTPAAASFLEVLRR